MERLNLDKYLDFNNICGITDELKNLLIIKKSSKKNVLVVCNTIYSATQIYNSIKNHTDNVCFFPMDDFLSSEIIALSSELKIARLEVLNELKDNKNKIIVTNLMGYLKFLPDKQRFYGSFINIFIKQNIKQSELIEQLYEIGYNKETMVNKMGDMSVRGFVVDIFPIGLENPIRIEFWGDEVESIRVFDVDTQLKIDYLTEIEIPPNLENGTSSSIRDYIDNLQVIFNNYDDIFESYHNLLTEIKEFCIDYNKSLDNKFVDDFRVSDLDINLTELDSNFSDNKINLDSYKIDQVFVGSEVTNKILKGYQDKYSCTTICVGNRYQANKVIEWLDNNEAIFTDINNLYSDKINVIVNNITNGFIFNNEVFISENEIFNKNKKYSHYKSKFKYGKKIKDIGKLDIGDFIVHTAYGIGKYCGIKTLKKGDLSKDYIQLEYKDGDKLYIPVENMEFISKYSSHDAVSVKLNKLGTAEWTNTKARAQKRAHDMADELLKLYALREMKKGFAFPKDDKLQIEFENEFKYQATTDQFKVIEDIKKDMESIHPMDRLLCGDVGFGKTEVAFRAIFKAILAGKQVAFLCPTTILASQHYHGALERFKSFPVEIRLMNRFVTTKKINDTIKKLESGEVDLIIGTHKILNDAVKFKDLGLLIIDEEQRFGVRQKEKIKHLKENVDVLTISATPIPRTLNMSLAGLRDLSTIETPPSNRYPVQTYVLVENDKIIKDSIYKEIARNGQVFILFNSVKHIQSKFDHISKLVPDAKVIYAHGQMEKNELEDIMFKFINKEFDVLICTTIIETGIDIPNANTLIILDSNNLGISQLYQLRGRVGRTDRLAYCYLMYDPKNTLTEVAIKRLNTIKEFTELGSGLSVSLRDLAIRGSGNLLGSNQTGFIDDIGIELFTKMLKDEIEKLKGTYIEKTINSKPLIEVSTTVEDNYVLEQELKIEIHKMINEVDSYEKLIEIKDKIEDRFGKINENLIIYMYEEWFQSIASNMGIKEIKQSDDFIEIMLTKNITEKMNGEFLFLELLKLNKNFRFRQLGNNLIVTLPLLNLERHFIYYLVDFATILEKSI